MRFLTTFEMTTKSPSKFEGVSGAAGRGSLYENIKTKCCAPTEHRVSASYRSTPSCAAFGGLHGVIHIQLLRSYISFKEKYIKYLILLISLVILMSCNSLKNTTSKTKNLESLPTFETQKEGNEYMAKRFFEKQYVKSEYSKFNGEIKTSDSTIQFGKMQFVEFWGVKSIRLIFEKGLLYPDIFDGGEISSMRGKRDNKEIEQLYSDTLEIVNRSVSITVCCLEELTFLSNDPTVKRFKLWLFHSNILNPDVYYFELINETANKETNLKSFIENAKLTFIKYGGFVL